MSDDFKVLREVTENEDFQVRIDLDWQLGTDENKKDWNPYLYVKVRPARKPKWVASVSAPWRIIGPGVTLSLDHESHRDLVLDLLNKADPA